MRTINGDGHVIEVIDVTHRTDGMTKVTFVDRSNDKVWTEDVIETLDRSVLAIPCTLRSGRNSCFSGVTWERSRESTGRSSRRRRSRSRMPDWILCGERQAGSRSAGAARRQCEKPAVPSIVCFPQSGEADSEKQDDDQQAGNGEPESSHWPTPR